MKPIMPRSALFMPGTNARALEKAQSLACDAVIFDLEDSVAPTMKSAARTGIAGALDRWSAYGKRRLAVRTNALDHSAFAADILLARQADVVVVPKVSTRDELFACQWALEGSTAALWIMIETPQAILNIRELAHGAVTDAPALQAFVLGTNDLAQGVGVPKVPGRWNMVPWFSEVVLAAAGSGLAVLDSVSNNFRDLEAFAEECLQGAQLGMVGKTLIHPAQIEACNQAFGPSAEEIDRAKTIISSFDDPKNADVGAIQIEGEMVERLHLKDAIETIRRATAFGQFSD